MIRQINEVELQDAVDRIAEIYLTNFNDRRPLRELSNDILKLSKNDGFMCLISTQLGTIDGYLYGYKSEVTQFYRQLLDQFLSTNEKGMLEDAFEIVSIAVDKSIHNNGIGTQLLDALPPGKYYLTSDVHDVPANTFYYKNDWTLLKSNMYLHPSIPQKNLYYKEVK
ncbi:hypothetical protein [Macrococcus armenti]|uniref:GNAT family N-acetyltransferase n=1 Tax=Macrococcus armenti TaxID=2875764 RepID=A0ABY3ZVD3_9STAP|nr:hypothetical protein [Macrococcus armenti]UOB20851.1 hypothetical protein MRZ06_01830 [Macrococcus armenti]